jgi:hypothetical protein
MRSRTSLDHVGFPLQRRLSHGWCLFGMKKEIDFFQKRMVDERHPVGFASGPGLIDPKALRFIHFKISSVVIAERWSCENTVSLWYLCPSRKLRRETRVF